MRRKRGRGESQREEDFCLLSSSTYLHTYVQYYPTSNNGMQNGSSVGTCTRCVHVFARLAQISMLSRCLPTKFLHRSSGQSLLRVPSMLVGQVGGGGGGGKDRLLNNSGYGKTEAGGEPELGQTNNIFLSFFVSVTFFFFLSSSCIEIKDFISPFFLFCCPTQQQWKFKSHIN